MPRYLEKNCTVLVRIGCVYAFVVFILGMFWWGVACGVVLIVAFNHLNRRVYRQCADPLLAASEQGLRQSASFGYGSLLLDVDTSAVNFGVPWLD